MYTRDAIYYDTLHGEAQSLCDLPFYQEMVPAGAKRILEVACGTGRILLELAAPERELVGVDLSPDMIRLAEEKSEARGIPATLQVADMTDLPDLGEFDVVICGFNSMNHLKDMQEVQAFLKGVRRSLAPSGIFLLDLEHDVPREIRLPRGAQVRIGLFEREDGATVEASEEVCRYPETMTKDIIIHYSINYEHAYTETYRQKLFPPEMMLPVFHACGLEVLHQYGFYDQSPFDDQSLKQIYVLGRAPES